MKKTLLLALLIAPASALAAQPAVKPTSVDAKTFVARVNDDLKRLWVRQSTAEWIKNTYITDDTERNAASADEDVMEYLARTIKDATRFVGLKLDPETERMLYLLRVSQSLPAPSDPKKREELAAIAAKLDGMYGKGKWCGS